MNVKVVFYPDNVTTTAQTGEPLLVVAERAGVEIPTGCLMGSCHACEVELGDGSPICACISSVPIGVTELSMTLYDDPVW